MRIELAATDEEGEGSDLPKDKDPMKSPDTWLLSY